MTNSINPAKSIHSIFKERDIPVKSKEITQALDDGADSREEAQWLGLLSQDSLLSQEELALYAYLSLFSSH